MNLMKLLTSPISRLKVDDSVLPNFEKELEIALRRRGLPVACPNPNALLKRLVQEAYARAGRQEPDGIPRNGPMEDHIEDIAERIESIWGGNVEVDKAINTILVQYGFKSAP
jgi:hypothetical protein